MSSKRKTAENDILNAQAGSAQVQYKQIKELEPYQTALGKLQLQNDTKIQELPIWQTGRDRAVPLYNQMPTTYENIDENNADVQKWQNMFDGESQTWAKNQMNQNNKSDASGKTFGSSYSAMRDATLQNELAQQKSGNLINAINTVGGNYATNQNNLSSLIGSYLGDGSSASYTPISYMSGSAGSGGNASLQALLAQIGKAVG